MHKAATESYIYKTNENKELNKKLILILFIIVIIIIIIIIIIFNLVQLLNVDRPTYTGYGDKQPHK